MFTLKRVAGIWQWGQAGYYCVGNTPSAAYRNWCKATGMTPRE